MAVKVGSLLISLGLETGAFKSGLDVAQRELRKSEKAIARSGKDMVGLGQNLSLAVTAPLAALGVQAVRGFQEQAQAMAQVNAALASMGPVAGKTAAELGRTADALEMNSLFDAEVILRDVTAQMLTFGNVSGTVFDRAQQAAIDMATRMGKEPQSAAIMLGKALNDPVKGVNALNRVGVQFTEQQKAQIAAMAESGRMAEAQGVILAEVERQFSGAAQAAADTSPWRKAQVAIGQAMDTVGEAIIPVIKTVGDAIAGAARVFTALPEPLQKAAVVGAALAAAFGPLLIVTGSLVTTFAPFIAVLGKIGAAGGLMAAVKAGFAGLAAVILPLALPLAAVAAAGALIYANWDKIAPVLAEFWQAAKEALGPPLVQIVTALSEIFSALWNGPLGEAIRAAGAAVAAFGGVTLRVLGPVLVTALRVTLQAFANLVSGISSGVKLVSAVLSGDWRAAFTAAAEIADRVLLGIPRLVASMVTAVRDWLVTRLNAVWDTVKAGIETVRKAFWNLYDAVVGHSYVPDMVDGIAREMARLDAVMVGPAGKAAAATVDAFRQLREDVHALMGGLFPEARAQADYLADRDLLDRAAAAGGAGFTREQLSEARDRLRARYVEERGPLPMTALKIPPDVVPDWKALNAEIGAAMAKIETGPGLLTSFGEAGATAFGEMSHQLKGVLLGVQSLGEALRNLVANLAERSLDWAFKSLGGSLGIPGFAAGTNFAPGGLAMVGERGPELVNLPRGSRVIPNHALRQGGGQVVHQPTFVFPGVTDARGAREAAAQAALRYRQELNGPLRRVG